YVSRAPKAVPYRAIDDNWLADGASAELAKVATWRPRAEDVVVAIQAGAGQFRTIGRVVSLSQARRIKQAVDTARNRLADPGVQPQMQRLSKHLGAGDSSIDVTPQVILVSSMAGGSGAGMFLDVADVIRAADPADWCDSSIGVMYTADVFSDIPELGRQGVMPNSLAALCELMNGYWNNSVPGPEYRALERAGIPVAGFQRRGLRYPLLVGRANNSVTFDSQNSVYEACAKTLAAFMTSPKAQNSVNAYLAGNWVAASVAMQDSTPFKDSTKGTVVSAMGMGSLSLGRDRFARYAAQRLARAAVEHALRAHTVGRKVPEEVTFEAARDEAAMGLLGWFVDQCGLDEIGEDRNQVVDQLKPTDPAPAQAVLAASGHQVQQFGELTPREYAAIIIQSAEQQRGAYVSATDQLVRQQAALWVDHVVAHIEAATLEAVARSGLEVTVELLRRLLDHVGDVINDLNTEVPKLEGWANQLPEGVYNALQEWGANVMTSDNELLVKARQRVVKAFEYDLDARVRRMASNLLDDLTNNLVRPLYDAARGALGGLHQDEHPAPGSPSLGIEDWPTGTTIPPALEPALNERLVEDISTYPGAYELQLVATARRPDAPTERLAPLNAERVAVGEILTGRGRDLDPGQVLVRLGEWWPQLLGSQRAASTARYELRFGGLDVLDRAEDWIHRRDTSFGEYVHQSLRTYVETDDPADRARRRTAVLDAFREVVGVAPPLVEVNNTLSQAVHGVIPTSQFHFTAVPFGQTELEVEILSIAENAGLGEQVLQRLRDAMGLGDEQRIEIITTLDAPVEPVTLQSVTRPIAEQWVKVRDNAATREQFWRWRRARALPEFVPLSPEVLHAMIQGWFLGRIVGALSWDKAAVHTEPVRIYDPEYRRDVEFPFPYLGGSPDSEQDLLPAVLESTALSMLESQARGSIEPLKAYALLRSIGENSRTHLRNWIQYGHTPDGTTPMERAWKHPEFTGASAADATAEDRKKAVLVYLQGRMRNYVERLDENPVAKATLQVQPRWLDLRDQLYAAFRSLMDEAAMVPTGGPDDGGD
ncbi:MAG: tubulin-like doman-containing protein, partial [Microthrixaceae bacterium]